MSDQFRVGDLALAVGLSRWKIYNGKVGKVTSVYSKKSDNEQLIRWVPFEWLKEKPSTDYITGVSNYKLKKL